LYFNEALLPGPVNNTQNFFVDNGIDFPRTAMLDAQNPGKVLLTFDRSFPSGMMLMITIQNMSDLQGNVSPLIEQEFMWFRPAVHDVQINEIMADPDPPVGLPNEEYVELFNTTDKTINLSGMVTCSQDMKMLQKSSRSLEIFMDFPDLCSPMPGKQSF